MCECQADFYTHACVNENLATDYPQTYPQRVFTNEPRRDIFDPRPAESTDNCRGPRSANGRVDSSVSADAGRKFKGPHSDPLLRDFYTQFIPEWRLFAPCGR